MEYAFMRALATLSYEIQNRTSYYLRYSCRAHKLGMLSESMLSKLFRLECSDYKMKIVLISIILFLYRNCLEVYIGENI